MESDARLVLSSYLSPAIHNLEYRFTNSEAASNSTTTMSTSLLLDSGLLNVLTLLVFWPILIGIGKLVDSS